MLRPPSVPPMLPHVMAVDSGHDCVLCTGRACSLDVALHIISCGRRTTSACAAHAPIRPCSARVLPAATAGPHAPRKIIRDRSAHVRRLEGMLHLSSPPDVVGAETGAPALLERVARSVADLDGHMAACVEAVPVASQQRRCSVRGREAYPGPPSPKGPHPVHTTLVRDCVITNI